jgi:hypothetical protein
MMVCTCVIRHACTQGGMGYLTLSVAADNNATVWFDGSVVRAAVLSDRTRVVPNHTEYCAGVLC